MKYLTVIDVRSTRGKNKVCIDQWSFNGSADSFQGRKITGIIASRDSQKVIAD